MHIHVSRTRLYKWALGRVASNVVCRSFLAKDSRVSTDVKDRGKRSHVCARRRCSLVGWFITRLIETEALIHFRYCIRASLWRCGCAFFSREFSINLDKANTSSSCPVGNLVTNVCTWHVQWISSALSGVIVFNMIIALWQLLWWI